ncbi:MAG: hypothetical protein AAF394_14605 [Planctomycetota bacterium]
MQESAIPFARPSWLYAQVWKELRQVVPQALLVWGICAAIQITDLILNQVMTKPEVTVVSSGISMFVPYIAGALVAIISAGMLVGHETQTRTWEWNSGLPISWKSALAVKLGVSVFLSILAFVTLLPYAAYLSESFLEDGLTSIDYTVIGLTFYCTSLSISVLIFFLVSLLIREPVHALTVGLLASVLLQICTIAVLSGIHGPDEILFPGILVTITLVALLLILTGLTFSVRWMRPFSVVPLPSTWMSSRTQVSAVVAPRREGQPSEWLVMLRLSLGAFWFVRLLLVLVPCVIGLIAVSLNGTPHTESAMWAILVSGMLGATAFADLQGDKSYQFLADRGVRTLPFLLQRLLVIFAWLALCTVSILVTSHGGDAAITLEPAFYAGCIMFTLIGCLSSLVFEKPIVSMAITFILIFVGFITNASAMQLASVGSIEEWGKIFNAIWLTSIPYLLVTYFSVGRRWLTQSENRNAIWFLLGYVVAIALPIPVGLAVWRYSGLF